MGTTLREEDIIFPQATNFSETLHSLKKRTLGISNRLRSIQDDATFVCKVADAFSLPLVANERCGSWYIPPERKAASAYFKSTDGHMNQWSFSLRRLNTQLFDLIAEHGGCILVDSTRRGKRMPDALSKTVPIWCTVLNRTLFPELPEAHQLFTPLVSVSHSEHAQIESYLERFVADLRRLNLPLDSFREKLAKPLRPFWITRDSVMEGSLQVSGFHSVILCTSSRRVSGAEMTEGGYIQGAGDDSESWAQGLTVATYWANRDRLYGTADDELPALIAELVENSVYDGGRSVKQVRPTSGIFMGDSSRKVTTSEDLRFDAVLDISETVLDPPSGVLPRNYLCLKCRLGKLGSRDLRNELPKLNAFLESLQSVENLLVRCATEGDLSAGLTLAILCKYCADDGSLQYHPIPRMIDKTLIRQRLSWIMTSIPDARPSRATLQSVNDFLMSDRRK